MKKYSKITREFLKNWFILLVIFACLVAFVGILKFIVDNLTPVILLIGFVVFALLFTACMAWQKTKDENYLSEILEKEKLLVEIDKQKSKQLEE